MKKILFLTLAGILLLNTGCNDFDLNPSTSLPTTEAITNAEDLQLALDGVYEMMSLNRSSHASDLTLYADAKGGDSKPLGDNGQITPFHKYEVTQNHSLAYTLYTAIYEPIAFSNMAMEGAEALGVDKADIKPLYGELIAVRAILHFEAARIYAQLPTITGVDMNKANSGVVLASEVYPPSTRFSRSTLQETYTFITTELEKAIPMLSTGKVQGGISAWGAKAILARAYLYLGENDKAYTTAVDVITNSPYKLFSAENYVSSWGKIGADEFIFEILTSDSNYNNPQRNSIGYYTNPDGYAEVGVNDNLLAAFQALNANDIRQESISERATATGAKKGFYTIKYMGQDGAMTALYVNNPKLARLAEVYLIASEAAIKGGSTADNALKYYNDLRRSRYATGTYTDATTVTIDNILDERRVELFCENHRLFDLVRNNKTVTRYDGVETFEPSDKWMITPIPLAEIDVNSPELEQSPGY